MTTTDELRAELGRLADADGPVDPRSTLASVRSRARHDATRRRRAAAGGVAAALIIAVIAVALTARPGHPTTPAVETTLDAPQPTPTFAKTRPQDAPAPTTPLRGFDTWTGGMHLVRVVHVPVERTATIGQPAPRFSGTPLDVALPATGGPYFALYRCSAATGQPLSLSESTDSRGQKVQVQWPASTGSACAPNVPHPIIADWMASLPVKEGHLTMWAHTTTTHPPATIPVAVYAAVPFEAYPVGAAGLGELVDGRGTGHSVRGAVQPSGQRRGRAGRERSVPITRTVGEPLNPTWGLRSAARGAVGNAADYDFRGVGGTRRERELCLTERHTPACRCLGLRHRSVGWGSRGPKARAPAGAGRAQGGSPDGARGPRQRGLPGTGDRGRHDDDRAGRGVDDPMGEQG